MTKPVTLFGRKMRKGTQYGPNSYQWREFFVLRVPSTGKWFGAGPSWNSPDRTSPSAAARALERKIVAAHRRLGKLIGTGGGR